MSLLMYIIDSTMRSLGRKPTADETVKVIRAIKKQYKETGHIGSVSVCFDEDTKDD